MCSGNHILPIKQRQEDDFQDYVPFSPCKEKVITYGIPFQENRLALKPFRPSLGENAPGLPALFKNRFLTFC